MTLLGAFVARMLNTCSIGRRWKSREGWSRPVLTGERGTLFPIPLLGWGLGLVLWWFSRWMARNAVSCGHDDDTGKAFCLRPLSGSRTATIGIVVGSVAGRSVWSAVQSGFAVVMAQVRRPVPFRTRKLRPGTAMVLHSRGCGRVARRRIQRWGFPSSFGSGNPHFCFSSGFFRAFTDLPATPFRLVEGVFPWLASLSFLRTSRPGIHDSPKGSSPIRGLPADAGRGRPVFLS